MSLPNWVRRRFQRQPSLVEAYRPEPAVLTDFQQSLDIRRVYTKGRLPDSIGARPPRTIRLVSWNIERGHQPDRLLETLLRFRPDVVCLQEVDWGNERTGFADVLAYLAERTGLLGLYVSEFVELRGAFRAPRFAGGGVTGNAILTRFEPRSVARVELPPFVDWESGAADERLPRYVRDILIQEPRLGRRCAIVADLAIGDQSLIVCSAHLENMFGGVQGRWSQFLSAAAAVDARRQPGATQIPGVIAGDFNTLDSPIARWRIPETNATALGKPTWLSEAAWWKRTLLPATAYADPLPLSAWTYEVRPFYRAKLDWITTAGATVRRCGIGPFSSSDHRPIWANLDLEHVGA